ncbi:MAG: DUF898 family protein [Candidatus Margulisbacteria bacterium]|nr:DUF898 family protein [Candidatus Margulisiibacteriota bacterium]
MTTSIVYNGKRRQLLWIGLSSLILTLFTLFIYSFWAITKLRRFFSEHLSIDGHHLSYHGTGKELFIGAFKFFALFVLINIASEFVFYKIQFLKYFILYIFFSYVIFDAYKYRASRTSYKGLQFSLSGSKLEYFKLIIKRSVLNFLSFGVLAPKSTILKYEYIFSNLRIGAHAFSFNSDYRHLLKLNIITLILLIPTLGISRLWYSHAMFLTIIRGGRLESIQLSSNLPLTTYIKFKLVNVFLVLVPFILFSLYYLVLFIVFLKLSIDNQVLFIVAPFILFYIYIALIRIFLHHRWLNFISAHVHIFGDLSVISMSMETPPIRPDYDAILSSEF